MAKATWLALAGLAATTAALAPVAARPGPEWFGITAFFCGAVLVAESATSVLLFLWFRAERTWSLLVLASAYLFSAVMILPYLATFPGAMAADARLAGGPQTGAWVFSVWLTGFALLALLAVALEARKDRLTVSPAVALRAPWLAGVIVAVVCAATVAVAAAGPRFMPNFVSGHAFTPAYLAINVFTTAILLMAVALALIRLRHSELFGWLALALAATAAANVLAGLGGGRFTIGWTASRVSSIAAACVLLGFFLRLFARQQWALTTARDTLEARVDERTRELSRALGARDVLLREVHHRVKNNLQIVDSLLHAQSRRLASDDARAAIEDTRRRIYTLALSHQHLLSDVSDERFAMRPFLEALIENLRASLDASARGVRIETDVAPVSVGIDRATPIGLIVSELVANAVKHAFADEAEKVVMVRLAQVGAQLQLSVSDTGQSGGAAALSSSRAPGAEIVRALARQLDASLVVTTVDGGAVTLLIPEPAVAPRAA